MRLASRRVVGIIWVLLLALGSGCASAPKPRPIYRNHDLNHRDEIESLMMMDIGKTDDQALENYLRTDTELEHYRKHTFKRLRREIPKEIDARVRWWIYYYAIREHVLFQRMLDRGEQYRKMITEQLSANLMPPELYNLAMIESGFVVHARSDANARGIWQLIAGTATRYGLHVDRYADERNHPLLATKAALRHLLSLRREFKSWYLVLAAYNAGPERIRKAMKRGRSTDFWVLARRHVLPAETMDYVPKFMAAVIISSHYAKFGFQKPTPVDPYPELAAVQVRPGISLAHLAKKGDISLSMLRWLNSDLNEGIIPPQKRRAVVWVPALQAEAFQKSLTRKVRRRPRFAVHAKDLPHVS